MPFPLHSEPASASWTKCTMHMHSTLNIFLPSSNIMEHKAARVHLFKRGSVRPTRLTFFCEVFLLPPTVYSVFFLRRNHHQFSALKKQKKYFCSSFEKSSEPFLNVKQCLIHGPLSLVVRDHTPLPVHPLPPGDTGTASSFFSFSTSHLPNLF